MCEISFCNTNDTLVNTLLGHQLAIIGSKSHSDGVGYIKNNEEVWKTHLKASVINNFGSIMSKMITNNDPLALHIRSATRGIKVTSENAHPFVGKHYILMHNGTLILKDARDVAINTDVDSDSLEFLMKLDEIKDSNVDWDFSKIFSTAMEKYAGKFAFVIREKETGTNFIVRGRTAELWISYLSKTEKGTPVGYVINTNKDTLLAAKLVVNNILPLVERKALFFTEPELLEAESMFIAQKLKVKKCGVARENVYVKVINNPTNSYPYNKGVVVSKVKYNGSQGTKVVNQESVRILKAARKIYEFLSAHHLTLLDFQMLVQFVGGVSVLELNEQDIDFFIAQIIPVLSASKKTRKEVGAIIKDKWNKEFPHEVYSEKGLEYPWMLEQKEKVLSAIGGE